MTYKIKRQVIEGYIPLNDRIEQGLDLEVLRGLKPKYKVIFDCGKPYEVFYNTDKALKQGLKEFYERNKDEGYFNAEVYGFKEELDLKEWIDISESQFINEIIGEILEND